MKYIKLFEDKEDIDIIKSIHDILISLDDEGHIVNFIPTRSASGNSNTHIDVKEMIEKKEDIIFNRWVNSKRSFRFCVDFREYIDYEKLSEFLSDSKTEISRIKEIGFKLTNVDILDETGSDSYQVMSVEFSFEEYKIF